MFALSKYVERKKGERFVVLIHNLNMFISFLLSLSTVIISTAANVSIIHGGFDPIATNGYMMLKREFELQFITCRFAFLTSWFTFLIGVLSRGVLEFNFMDEDRRDGLYALDFFFSGIVTALTSYINTTTYGFSNFIHMAFVMCKLLIMKVLVQRTPLMITSLL